MILTPAARLPLPRNTLRTRERLLLLPRVTRAKIIPQIGFDALTLTSTWGKAGIKTNNGVSPHIYGAQCCRHGRTFAEEGHHSAQNLNGICIYRIGQAGTVPSYKRREIVVFLCVGDDWFSRYFGVIPAHVKSLFTATIIDINLRGPPHFKPRLLKHQTALSMIAITSSPSVSLEQ